MEIENVFIVGYRNHAHRIIANLSKSGAYKNIYIYHPNKEVCNAIKKLHPKSIATNIFSDCLFCSSIYIASPSETHVFYLKKLLELSNGDLPYIYCEKPVATTTSEIKWLKTNYHTFKNKLFVGFNLNFSNFPSLIEKLIASNEIGSPIYANFHVSYGLAFKKEFDDNWRFNNQKPFSTLIGNLGIHYINMCVRLFGEPIKSSLIEAHHANHKNSDTCILQMRHASNVTSNIFLSYATIYNEEYKVCFTDGEINQSQGKIKLFYPRDIFDANGEFTRPNPETLYTQTNERDSTLSRSINFFINKVVKGIPLEESELESSINTSSTILKLLGH